MVFCKQRFDDFGVTLKVMHDNTLRFRYRIDSNSTCEFSLLSEVGQPWRPAFDQLIEKHGLVLSEHATEFSESPWVASALKTF